MAAPIERKGSDDRIESAPEPGLPQLDRTESVLDKKEDVTLPHIVAADNSMDLFGSVKHFPMATMYSVLGAMTAVSDGFQYNLPGAFGGEHETERKDTKRGEKGDRPTPAHVIDTR